MEEITIKKFTFNDFQENTYVLSHSNGQAIIVDPGCHSKNELKMLFKYIADHKLDIQLIINTHCHIDHVLGNADVVAKYQCPLWAPIGEKEVLHSMPAVANLYGMSYTTSPEPDYWYSDSDLINLGPQSLKVINVPGHSPDSMVLYWATGQWAIAGDVLFRDSIGRTDLPGGNHQALLTNIKEKMYTLPEETVIYPGHGPTTTIGYEKNNNPFVRG